MQGYGRLLMVVVAVLAGQSAVMAQAGDAGPVAYVTVVRGEGATRGVSGPQFPNTIGDFNDKNSGLRPGESVVTREQGTAVVLLPDYGVVAHLEGSTELKLAEVAARNNDVPVALRILRGRAHIVQKPSDKAWLLVGGGTGDTIGYTLSMGASVLVQVQASGVTFVATGGRATFFNKRIPDGPLIGADGQPIDRTGVDLPESGRITTQKPAAAERDQEMPRLAWKRMNDELYAFGVDHSSQWVEEAEKGDFTPVRSETAASPRAFEAEVGIPRQTFDQPRQAVTTPPGRAALATGVAGQVSPAQQLIGSQIPASVVIGQRIRRSRIIGNPGTTGTGQIRFNPNAVQLIQLAGRPGRR